MASTPLLPGGEARRVGSGTDRTEPPDRSAPVPSLLLRPRPLYRALGPVLLLVGIALVATGRVWGGGIALVGLLALPMTWFRIEVGDATIRRRDWHGAWHRVPIDSLTGLRLRRVPFRVLRWVHHAFRIGRVWTVPLTLRLLDRDHVRLELRCCFWRDWQALARFVATCPDIDIDPRTRGRFDRYVGPIELDTSSQR
jgi:hypothetical protein